MNGYILITGAPGSKWSSVAELGIRSPSRSNGIHTYADRDIKVYVYK